RWQENFLLDQKDDLHIYSISTIDYGIQLSSSNYGFVYEDYMIK
ncbi:18844_t:CDS:2, partial [Gigaspora rosea]